MFWGSSIWKVCSFSTKCRIWMHVWVVYLINWQHSVHAWSNRPSCTHTHTHTHTQKQTQKQTLTGTMASTVWAPVWRSRMSMKEMTCRVLPRPMLWARIQPKPGVLLKRFSDSTRLLYRNRIPPIWMTEIDGREAKKGETTRGKRVRGGEW